MFQFFSLALITTLFINQSSAKPASSVEGYIFAHEAYQAASPLVVMELIRKTMTEGESKKGNMGEFIHERSFLSPDFKTPWTNADMLYSVAWVDLSKEPYILYLPEFGNRLFQFPLISAWYDPFFEIHREGKYALVGPLWKGTLPKDVDIIKSPTNNIFIAGRIFSSGKEDDLEKVRALQDKITLMPFFSEEKGFSLEKLERAPKKKREDYFTLIAKTLVGNPPLKEKDTILTKLKRVGIKEDVPYMHKVDLSIVSAMKAIKRKNPFAFILEKEIIQSRGSWFYSLQEGTQGIDYMRRALPLPVARTFPQENIYLFTDRDESFKRLNGKERYILHFSQEKLPKVKGTWSLTAYDEKGHLVQNALNRHALNFLNPLQYNEDGSLDLYIQNRYPGKHKEENWLPVPEKNFSLILRLYLPGKEILENLWIMPEIKKESLGF